MRQFVHDLDMRLQAAGARVRGMTLTPQEEHGLRATLRDIEVNVACATRPPPATYTLTNVHELAQGVVAVMSAPEEATPKSAERLCGIARAILGGVLIVR